MTPSSTKWAYYAPDSPDARVAFGSLAECVHSGLAGSGALPEIRFWCRAIGVMATGALLDYYRVTVPAARTESVASRSGVEDSRERASSESRLECFEASTEMYNLIRRRRP